MTGEIPSIELGVNQRMMAIIADSVHSALLPTLSMESNLSDLGIDSLTTIAIAQAIEEEFSVVIPDNELGRLKTVSDVVWCVIGKLTKAERARS